MYNLTIDGNGLVTAEALKQSDLSLIDYIEVNGYTRRLSWSGRGNIIIRVTPIAPNTVESIFNEVFSTYPDGGNFVDTGLGYWDLIITEVQLTTGDVYGYFTVYGNGSTPEPEPEPVTTFNFKLVGDSSKVEAFEYVGEVRGQSLALNTDLKIAPNNTKIRIYPLPEVEIIEVKSKTPPAQPYKLEPSFNSKAGGFWESTTIGNYSVDVFGGGVYGVYEINAIGGGGTDVLAPFNRIYAMDKTALESLASVDMYQTISTEEGTSNVGVSRANFIINLLNLPFKLDPDFIVGNGDVYLGKYNTNIDAPILEGDKLELDLGEIEIDDLENSILDIEGVKLELIAPFINTLIPLEPYEVNEKIISVKYVIDLYTGSLTVNVYNGGLLPIRSINSVIGRSIPIKVRADVERALGSFNGVYNGVYYAYIRRVKPDLIIGSFNNLVTVNEPISGNSGYLEVLEPELNINATSSEKSEIINLLKSGVIINA